MINEAPTTSARPALTSIKQDRIVQTDCEVPINSQLSTLNARPSSPQIALLTGGRDKPYALGIAAALTSVGISVDFIGGDSLPMHFALGTRTPCVTLFTCTSPWEIYDYGTQKKIVSPFLKEFFYKRGYDERATRAITVDEVLDAVITQLDTTASKSEAVTA